jgi:hypothetical protein
MIVPFTDCVKKARLSGMSGMRTTRVSLSLGTSAGKDVTPRLSCGGEDGSRRKSRDSEDQGMTVWFILNWT